MASVYGRFLWVTLSELMKKYSMDQLEDEYDRQTAEIAHKLWVESGKETISMQEVFAEFGELE